MQNDKSKSINYIRHLENVHDKFSSDNRLSPWHISLYMSLFHTWNHLQFQNPFSLVRAEQMNDSKIGSANTYLKCLKELELWEYIKYYPSHNPMKGSQVYLYRFDTTGEQVLNKSYTSPVQLMNKSCTTPTQLVRPLINSIKLNKLIKTNETSVNGDEINFDTKSKINKKEILLFEEVGEDELPIVQQEKKATPQNLEEVQIYFLEKKYAADEAEKFYNYYESNGWMVGKNKMKNWRAASSNWISNSGKYEKKNSREKPNYLHVNQDKDYSIPL